MIYYSQLFPFLNDITILLFIYVILFYFSDLADRINRIWKRTDPNSTFASTPAHPHARRGFCGPAPIGGDRAKSNAVVAAADAPTPLRDSTSSSPAHLPPAPARPTALDYRHDNRNRGIYRDDDDDDRHIHHNLNDHLVVEERARYRAEVVRGGPETEELSNKS